MTDVINQVHYTQYSEKDKAVIEQVEELVRDRKLSIIGAQCVLKQCGFEDAIVTRIETLIYSR